MVPALASSATGNGGPLGGDGTAQNPIAISGSSNELPESIRTWKRINLRKFQVSNECKRRMESYPHMGVCFQPSKTRSSAWQHGACFITKTNEPNFICFLCGATGKCPPPSTLLRHLSSKHAGLNLEDDDTVIDDVYDSATGRTGKGTLTSAFERMRQKRPEKLAHVQKEVDFLVARWIFAEQLPLHIIDSPYLRDVIRAMGYELKSRTWLRSQLAVQHKEHLVQVH